MKLFGKFKSNLKGSRKEKVKSLFALLLVVIAIVVAILSLVLLFGGTEAFAPSKMVAYASDDYTYTGIDSLQITSNPDPSDLICSVVVYPSLVTSSLADYYLSTFSHFDPQLNLRVYSSVPYLFSLFTFSGNLFNVVRFDVQMDNVNSTSLNNGSYILNSATISYYLTVTGEDSQNLICSWDYSSESDSLSNFTVNTSSFFCSHSSNPNFWFNLSGRISYYDFSYNDFLNYTSGIDFVYVKEYDVLNYMGYTSMADRVNNYDSLLSDLETANETITSLNSTINSLNDSIISLQSDLNEANLALNSAYTDLFRAIHDDLSNLFSLSGYIVRDVDGDGLFSTDHFVNVPLSTFLSSPDYYVSLYRDTFESTSAYSSFISFHAPDILTPYGDTSNVCPRASNLYMNGALPEPSHYYDTLFTECKSLSELMLVYLNMYSAKGDSCTPYYIYIPAMSTTNNIDVHYLCIKIESVATGLFYNDSADMFDNLGFDLNLSRTDIYSILDNIINTNDNILFEVETHLQSIITDLQFSYNELESSYNNVLGSVSSAYSNGYNSALNDTTTVVDGIKDVLDSPFDIIRNMFDFEIFGINISAIIMFILSLLLIGFVIKKIV